MFSDRLMRQRRASPHTITSYRDTSRLLVGYARRELNKAPVELAVNDLDTEFLGASLTHLETDRGNSARTLDTRLTAIRSFLGYVALQAPEPASRRSVTAASRANIAASDLLDF